MSKRILVIDDEEAIRKSFLLALEDTEYEVDLAESGNKGIELYHKGEYDLVFLDLKMPGLNGVETLREIKKMDSSVRAYIITAFYEEYFEELKKLQKEDIHIEVLRKPIGMDEIALITKSILEGPIVID
jgi:CheY-like chemotaxis protein